MKKLLLLVDYKMYAKGEIIMVGNNEAHTLIDSKRGLLFWEKAVEAPARDKQIKRGRKLRIK